MAFRIYRGIWQFKKADGSFENKYKLNQSGELVITDATGTVELGPATVTQADADSRYLSLSGGTVTGAAHFTHTSNTYAGDSATITGRVQAGDVTSTSGRFGSSSDGGQDCYMYISDANNTYQEYTYGADFSFAGDTSYSNSILIAGGLQADKGVKAAKFYINDGNTKLEEGSGDALRITTTTGYIDIGSKNTGWIHFEGNRPYYFGNSLSVDGNVTPYSNNIRNLGGPSQRWATIYGLNGDFSGDLVVGGTVTAQEFRTEYITQAVILQSGSTVFGNTYDDTHRYTGSLEILGSGSTILDVQGSQGQLFSVTDSLTGTLMSVNDISGLPILEVFDNDKVVMGAYNQNTLVVTGSKVGIGTDAPSQALEVVGNVGATGAIFDAQTFNAVDSTFNSTNTTINSTNIIVGNNTTDNVYVGGSTMYIRDGKVGIGTTTPNRLLTVIGDSTFDGFLYFNASGKNIQIDHDGSRELIQVTRNSVAKWNIRGEVDDLRFRTGGGSDVLNLTQTGNVGIGTTSPVSHSPSRRTLVVADTVNGANVEIWGNSGGGKSILQSVSGNTYVGNLANGSGAGTTYITSGNGNTYTTFLANGNIGIGTTSPGYKLDIRTTSSEDAQIALRNTSSGNAGIYFDASNGDLIGSDYAWIGQRNDLLFDINTNSGAGDIVLSPGGTEKVRFAKTGNVGIGTTSPVDPLHIVSSGNDKFIRIENTSSYTGIWMNDSGTNSGWLVLSGYTNTTSPGDFAIREYGVQTSLTIKQTTGNVGIGTSSPTYKLQITESDYARISLHQSTTGAIWQWGNDGSNMYAYYSNSGVRAIDIKQNGNVGIGTTNPSSMLTLNGPTPYIRFERSNVPTWELRQNFPSTEYGFQIVNVTAGTIPFFVGNSGNVGIGTTAPSSKLHIVTGTPTGAVAPSSDVPLLIDSSGHQFIEFRTTSAASGLMQGTLYSDNGKNAFIGYKEYTGAAANTYGESIHIAIKDFSASDAGSGIYLGATSNPTLGVTTPYMFIKGNGNVGIGTTSPSQKLHVAGGRTYLETGNEIYTLGISRSGANAYYLGVSNSSSPDLYFSNNAGTTRVTLTDAGNVGIGTTAPGDRLEVVSPATNTATFRNSVGQQTVTFGSTANTAYSDIILKTNSGNGEIFKAGTGYTSYGGALALNIYNSNGAIAFHPNGIVNAMFINTSGNVGIGTTSPTVALDVVGDFKATGAYINGASDNSGKSDFSVATGGIASLALAGGELRVGDTDVNWAVALRSNGNLGTYGQPLDLTTSSGDHAVNISVNGSGVASFNENVALIRKPTVILGGNANPETTDGYGLEIMGAYTDGRWNHRFVKSDEGGGVPLYVQKTTTTADVWYNVARFGLYSGNGYEFEVFGAAKVNSDFASTGQINASGGNSSQWNTAYGWGNHATAGYTTTPTPGTPGLSSKSTNGDGIAMTITAASNAEYYEIWSSINGTTSYGLVGKIDPSSVASTMSFQDDTPATTGTIYYRVYGINKGKYGSPLEFSHAFSYTCPDPATVTIASTLNMFMITWEPVQSRLCSGYTVTHHASSGTPTQGSATTIYTGKNTVALYPIPDGELDLNHQFWVTANTNT